MAKIAVKKSDKAQFDQLHRRHANVHRVVADQHEAMAESRPQHATHHKAVARLHRQIADHHEAMTE
jgi:hypothetical protein